MGNITSLNIDQRDLDLMDLTFDESDAQEIRDEIEENDRWLNIFMSMPDLQEAAVQFFTEDNQRRTTDNSSYVGSKSWIDIDFASNNETTDNTVDAKEKPHQEFEIRQEYYDLAKEAFKKVSMETRGTPNISF